MITLTKGDKLKADENLVVYLSGEYEKAELVLVSKADDIDNPLYQYQTIYIKEGYND